MGLTLSSIRSVVLKEQPDQEITLKEIAKMLQGVALLYQIPNWTPENSVILARWIMNNYPNETMNTVIGCLTNPPSTGEKNWRLTPDTIQEWFAIKLDEIAEKREKFIFHRKEMELNTRSLLQPDTTVERSPETQKAIDEYLETIKTMEIKSVRPLTQEEIDREGQERFDNYKQWKKDNGY